MIKNALLLFIFVILSPLFAENIKISELKTKEFIYLLEKDGYELHYQISKNELNDLFNTEIKKIETNSIVDVLNMVILNVPTITYFVDNKEIYFHKKNEKIEKINNSKKIKEIKNDITFNSMWFEIKENKNSTLLIKLLENKLKNNPDVVIKLFLTYYGTQFSEILISKENFENIKTILVNDYKEQLFNLNNEEISVVNLKNDIKDIKTIIKQYEQSIYLLNENLNVLNKNYFPYVNGYIHYFDHTYYYLKNISTSKENYVDKYNKLYQLKDNIYFKNDKVDCMINEKTFDISCENNDILIKY